MGNIHIHAFHIGAAIVFIVMVICMKMAREFLVKAMSESDPATGVDKPSHKRLIVFVFMLCVAFCEIYHTLKQGKFDFQHLIAFLITMLLYSGIATVAQVMTIWKGNTTSATVEEKKTVTVQTS